MNSAAGSAPGGEGAGGPNDPAAQGAEGANNAPQIDQPGPFMGPNNAAGPPADAGEAVMGALSNGGAGAAAY